jgi:hydroxyethylthiazole kinase-like sugar kinase family protein
MTLLPLGMKVKKMYDTGSIATGDVDTVVTDLAKMFIDASAQPALSSILREGNPLPATIQSVMASDEASAELDTLITRIKSGGKSDNMSLQGGTVGVHTCPHCDKSFLTSNNIIS